MPSGQNLWNELLADNKRRSRGDLQKLQGRLWFAISACHGGLQMAMEVGDHERAMKWCHCLSQLSGAYAKIVLDGDIEQRIKDLEQRAAANGHVNGSHAGQPV